MACILALRVRSTAAAATLVSSLWMRPPCSRQAKKIDENDMNDCYQLRAKVLTIHYFHLGWCELLASILLNGLSRSQLDPHRLFGQSLNAPNGLGRMPHQNGALLVFKHFLGRLQCYECVVAEVKLENKEHIAKCKLQSDK